jgi:VWFA-related protein
MLYQENSSALRPFGRLLPLSLVLLASLMAFAFAGPMQQPQAGQSAPPPSGAQLPMPTFSVQASMVVVDVTVRDRKGKLVGDLQRQNFKIYEDNAPQAIITFSAENVPIGPQPAAAVAEAAPAAAPVSTAAPKPDRIVNLGLNPDKPPQKEDLAGKRLVILFFDLSSLGTEDLQRSVDTAHDFVARQTGPQDLMAVATYSSTLELVQDFTNDRDLLLKTLKGLTSTDSGDGATEDLGDDTSEDVFVPDTVQFNIFNTDRRLSAIETLAKMYREFPERKSLIYFSSGVTTTGVENNAQIRSTVDNANRSNLSIYSVDSRGLVALPPGGNASQKSASGRAMFNGGAMAQQRSNLSGSQETLSTLSHDTGGKAFTDVNDLSLALQQVQMDTNVYYVIGYFSSNPKEDGKYRKIRVEVNPVELRVEHRPGYFASKAFAQLNQQERDLQLQQAMNVERPFSDVPVILQADYFRKDNSTTLVPISIELDGDGLKFEEKGASREGRFEFVAQVADPKGRVSGVARDSVQVKLPAEKAEKIKSGGIFYSTGFQLRPGEYKLKFLVRDNVTGKLGGFEQPIAVPSIDLKRLTTSSIVLGNLLTSARGDTGAGIAHQGMMRRFQELGITYDPLVMGNRRVVPSIGNVFVPRQTVYVYFQVYGASEDKETSRPCIQTDLILLRDGTKILETQPQYVQAWTSSRAGSGGMRGRGEMGRGPGGMGSGPGMGPGGRGGGGFGPMGGPPPGTFGAEERKGESTVAISLPLRSLKRGTYTLQVHVRDVLADTNLFQRVPIVIE